MNEDNKEETEKLDQLLSKIQLFPGSIKEYEQLKDYQVEIIDISKFGNNLGIKIILNEIYGDSNFKVYGDNNFKKFLINNKLETIVNCNISAYSSPMLSDTISFVSSTRMSTKYVFYGLPVRKK